MCVRERESVCVCVCEREREREENVCVCVCVREREREREREKNVCVCVCVLPNFSFLFRVIQSFNTAGPRSVLKPSQPESTFESALDPPLDSPSESSLGTEELKTADLFTLTPFPIHQTDRLPIETRVA